MDNRVQELIDVIAKNGRVGNDDVAYLIARLEEAQKWEELEAQESYKHKEKAAHLEMELFTAKRKIRGLEVKLEDVKEALKNILPPKKSYALECDATGFQRDCTFKLGEILKRLRGEAGG